MRGLSEKVIKEISYQKEEPGWMLKKRLKAYEVFKKKKMPNWGPDLSGLDFSKICFYHRASEVKTSRWEEVPKKIRRTFTALGIPKAEQKFLAGVGAQFESEIVYQNLKKKWKEKGVIFIDMDEAVKQYPDIVKKYFMNQCIPPTDNKFAALHGAVWSGGSFVYIPKKVKLQIPLQAYFWMQSQKMGQFEHTLIIADEGSSVHFIEGCSAPTYSTNSLHSGAVEIFVGKGARVRYSTIQNWSKNVYNLNTKRAHVEQDAIIEWVSGTMGSKVTMLYPSSYLLGKGARADHLSLTFAGEGQILDVGAKVIHANVETSSQIISKSVVKDGGQTTYRGLVNIEKGARNAKTHVCCDALILDENSQTRTFPHLIIDEGIVEATHEATTGKIQDEQLFYLTSRGIPEEEAKTLVINGFVEPIIKELPLEYAVEMNRLINLEMKGAIA